MNALGQMQMLVFVVVIDVTDLIDPRTAGVDNLFSMDIDKLDFLGLQQINYTCHFYKEMFKLFDEMGCSSCKANRVCGGECQAFNISKYGKVSMDKANCDNIKKTYDFISDNWYKILQKTTITVNSTGTFDSALSISIGGLKSSS